MAGARLSSRSAGRVAGLAVVCAVTCGVAAVAFGVRPGPSGALAAAVALLALTVLLIRPCCFVPEPTTSGPRIDFFQPGTVMAIFYVVYLLVPGWYVFAVLDFVSNWTHPEYPAEPLVLATFALGAVGLVAFGLGYRLQFPGARPPSAAGGAPWSDSGPLLVRRLPAFIVVFLVVGVVLKVAHLRALGDGSGDVGRGLLPEVSEDLELRFGGIPYFLSQLFDVGAILFLFRAMLVRRHRGVAAVVQGAAAVAAFLLSGKRSAVFPFVLFPVVWYHYLYRPISVKRGVGLMAVGGVLAAVLLFVRILGPRLFEDGLASIERVSEVSTTPLAFYLNSPELAIFDMTELAVQDRERLLHAAGGPGSVLKYNLGPLMYIVPRAVWPDKPTFIDLGQVFYQAIINGNENVGFSVGILGGFFLYGGLVAVIVGMFAIGVAFRAFYNARRRRLHDPASVFISGTVFWMCFQYLRFGTLGFTLLLFLQTQATGVVLVWLLSRPWPGQRAGGSSSAALPPAALP